MNKNELLEKALSIALSAHEGQTDKAGAAYILHPIRAANSCKTDEERIVALLHDVVEDTNIVFEELALLGFPERIIDAVFSITRRDGESYEDFIARSALDSIGRQVKLHDLEDNMDITRFREVTEKDLKRLNKYLKAYRFLNGQE